MTAEIPARVAKAVAIAAMESGVARVKVDPEVVYDYARKLIIEGNIPNLWVIHELLDIPIKYDIKKYIK